MANGGMWQRNNQEPGQPLPNGPIRLPSLIFPLSSRSVGPAPRPVTAATPTIPTATTPAGSRAAATTTTRRSRPRLADVEPTPLVIATVQTLDGGFPFSIVDHLDEPKATASTRFAIFHHLGHGDRPKRLEECLKFFRGHRKAEVSHIKPLCHRCCLEQALPLRQNGPNDKTKPEPATSAVNRRSFRLERSPLSFPTRPPEFLETRTGFLMSSDHRFPNRFTLL